MPNPRTNAPWNKCDGCGKFVSYGEFAEDNATHKMVTPESLTTWETWETLCPRCNQPPVSTQPQNKEKDDAD